MRGSSPTGSPSTIASAETGGMSSGGLSGPSLTGRHPIAQFSGEVLLDGDGDTYGSHGEIILMV